MKHLTILLTSYVIFTIMTTLMNGEVDVVSVDPSILR